MAYLNDCLHDGLILASSSMVRKKLLSIITEKFEVVKSDIDERAYQDTKNDFGASELAVYLAEGKAADVSFKYPDHIVIGADQTLDCDGEVFHKPLTMEIAAKQISILSGRTHKLHSAVAIAQHGQVQESFFCSALMNVHKLDQSDIRKYVLVAFDKGMLSSVGGYHFEGGGVRLFSSVVGNHSTILGLPLKETFACLKKLEAINSQ